MKSRHLETSVVYEPLHGQFIGADVSATLKIPLGASRLSQEPLVDRVCSQGSGLSIHPETILIGGFSMCAPQLGRCDGAIQRRVEEVLGHS